MKIEKYSLGMGDRFGKQGIAQLSAVLRAKEAGAIVTPVWNKSFREHSLIGTNPDDVRAEADEAVRALGWTRPYYVDADHVGLKTVDAFIEASDFFTLDVADFIDRPAPEDAIGGFVRDMAAFRGPLRIPGVGQTFEVTDEFLEKVGRRYLHAIGEAGRTYRHIATTKGAGNFITEISLDEASHQQLAFELFFILGAIARERIPIQTIAPRFLGRFLKGIDYVGHVALFESEFEADVLVVRHAIRTFGLPSSLKISIHTGSDKFSLYPRIRRCLRKHDAGVHLKTAGTTWLEELIGLSLSGARGLSVGKRVCTQALARLDELCQPYATVVDIERSRLPNAADVEAWSAEQFVRRLRHDAACPDYNAHLRQLLHVAFKIAAEMGEEFQDALDEARQSACRCVADNLFERHIRPLFLAD
jgi:hypothetical protein